MTNARWTKMMMAALFAAGSTLAMAQDAPSEPVETPKISINTSLALFSKYVWRGQLLNDDAVLQPSVGLGYEGLTASIWGNVDMTDYHDNEWEFTEYDWTLGYANTMPGIDWLSYSVGAIYYYFPSVPNDADTVEIYAGLGLPTMPLTPTVTMYRDVDEADGTYVAFSLSHSIEKIFELASDMPVGMTMGASIGWGSESYNKYYWSGLDDADLNDLTLTAGFPVTILGWTCTPSVNYVTLLSSDVRKADTYSTSSHNNDSDYFFTGLTVARSF